MSDLFWTIVIVLAIFFGSKAYEKNHDLVCTVEAPFTAPIDYDCSMEIEWTSLFESNTKIIVGDLDLTIYSRALIPEAIGINNLKIPTTMNEVDCLQVWKFINCKIENIKITSKFV